MKKCVSKKRYVVLSIMLVIAMIINVALCIAATPVLGAPATEDGPDLSQIVLNKTASKNPDGTVTINIESYVKGEISYDVEEFEAPADIVLCLDKSSSMTENFGNTSKRAALRNAVSSFIDSVSSRYTADTDHRVAIVTFNNSASILKVNSKNWTAVNASGASAIKTAVNNFNSFSGDTNVAAGLTQSQTLLNNLDYDGTVEGRRKVVILFTDGYPAASGDTYTDSYAENGVAKAYELKQAGVKIFSIGIFDDADKNIYYGSKETLGKLGYNVNNIGLNQDCEIYSYAENNDKGSSWYVNDNLSNTDNFRTLKANRFMNLVSSNFPTAQNMGLKDVTKNVVWGKVRIIFWDVDITRNYEGHEITNTYKKDSDIYYNTAADADQLKEVFDKISVIIEKGGTTIKLNKNAVLKDIVSDYFTLPDSVTPDNIEEKVSVKVAKVVGGDEDGNFVFGTPQKATDVFPDVKVKLSDHKTENDRRNVSVTGFDFSAHYVAYDPVTKKVTEDGYEIIISFDVEPIEGFSGGNNIPTNGPESGIYPDEESEPLLPCPEPIVDIDVTARESDLEFADLVTYQGAPVCVDPYINSGELDPLLDAFVKRNIYLVDATTHERIKSLAGGYETLDETTTYPKETIEIEFEPIKPSESGVGVEPDSVFNDEPFTIYVLNPNVKVTANDVEAFYGSEYELGKDSNALISLDWKEKNNLKTEADLTAGVVKPFDVDDLAVKYTCSGSTDNKTVTKAPLKVNLTVVSSEDSSSEYQLPVTYEVSCTHGCTSPRTDAYYLVHAKTGSLKITNVGGKAEEAFVYTVLKDGSPYTSVSVPGNSSGTSVTIKGLPVGEYTVVADGTWSWRYTQAFTDSKDKDSVTAETPDISVTCTNTSKGKTWIGAVSGIIKNIFGKGGK